QQLDASPKSGLDPSTTANTPPLRRFRPQQIMLVRAAVPILRAGVWGQPAHMFAISFLPETELAHKSTQSIQCAERNARFLFGCGSAALRHTSDTGVWVLKQPQHRARLYNHAAMVPLPIDASLPEIIANLRESRSLVLVAPPGAGKTTRVPPAILRANLLSP